MTHAIVEADVVRYLRGNQWLVQNGHIPKAHAVLCDPPYGLEFMGKEWDKPKPSAARFAARTDEAKNRREKLPEKYVAGEDFQAWVTEWATLLLDYVYPGALLMAFGGTRTYHRLAAGLEDAGWEIGDSMAWVYGSGFPKSHDLSKALDREAGATREVVGETVYGDGKTRPAVWTVENSNDGWKRPSHENYTGNRSLTAPATPLAARWQGYGTALKPAYEPVVIARAPRGNRTYAGLAREFGTGALAIDAGRIPAQGRPLIERDAHLPSNGIYGEGLFGARSIGTTDTGRWPANFALVCTCEGDDHADDCPVKVLGEQSGETGNGYRANQSTQSGSAFHNNNGAGVRGHADTGTAARFFYQAKASAWEREAGLHDRARRRVSTSRPNSPDATGKFPDHDSRDRLNVHPTVKPIRLAEYLARLILPPVLDDPRRLLIPFAGSGSEMVGALLAGWDVVTGIERETEYVELARARVGWWAQFSTYDEARAAYEKGRKAQPVAVVADRPADKPQQASLFDEEGI